MPRASRLLADLDPAADRVFLDADGLVVEAAPAMPPGDAALVVAPVTDALKMVEGGRVGESVDRDRVLRAVGFALSREVLGALGDRWIEPGALYRDVSGLGFSWRVSIRDSP